MASNLYIVSIVYFDYFYIGNGICTDTYRKSYRITGKNRHDSIYGIYKHFGQLKDDGRELLPKATTKLKIII